MDHIEAYYSNSNAHVDDDKTAPRRDIQNASPLADGVRGQPYAASVCEYSSGASSTHGSKASPYRVLRHMENYFGRSMYGHHQKQRKQDHPGGEQQPKVSTSSETPLVGQATTATKSKTQICPKETKCTFLLQIVHVLVSIAALGISVFLLLESRFWIKNTDSGYTGLKLKNYTAALLMLQDNQEPKNRLEMDVKATQSHCQRITCHQYYMKIKHGGIYFVYFSVLGMRTKKSTTTGDGFAVEVDKIVNNKMVSPSILRAEHTWGPAHNDQPEPKDPEWITLANGGMFQLDEDVEVAVKMFNTSSIQNAVNNSNFFGLYFISSRHS